MLEVNKKHIRVSIVIPAYNEERHLQDCLEAIAKQSVMPFEVIVVDNNSTDKTAELAARYPFVRVISELQQGIVFARNAGFNAALGDVIGRIDADITLPINWVEHISQFYSRDTNVDTVWSGRGFFYNVRFPHLVSWAYGLLAFRLNWLLIGHYTLWGSNMALRREQWLRVRDEVHTRTDIHEDLDIAMHLHGAGYRIEYDTTIKTFASLRRVNTQRDQLWEYLLWWPRTLRLHGYWTWVICWFFGAFLLYFSTYILVVADWLARHFGKRPLPQ